MDFEESNRKFRSEEGTDALCRLTKAIRKKIPLQRTRKASSKKRCSIPRILRDVRCFLQRRARIASNGTTRQAPKRWNSISAGARTLSRKQCSPWSSVERVYRTFRDPQTGPKDRIEMETKVDGFLAKHFRQYESYFGEQQQPDPSVDFPCHHGHQGGHPGRRPDRRPPAPALSERSPGLWRERCPLHILVPEDYEEAPDRTGSVRRPRRHRVG